MRCYPLFPATGPMAASGGLRVSLEGTATFDAGNELRDATARELPVRPWGIEVVDAASGMLSDRELIELELPASAARHARLELFVGHGLGRLLIDEALGGSGPRCQLGWTGGRPSTLADSASQLLGVATVLELTELGVYAWEPPSYYDLQTGWYRRVRYTLHNGTAITTPKRITIAFGAKVTEGGTDREEFEDKLALVESPGASQPAR